MGPYDAVLFDFDFTLADASAGILASISYALAKMGLPPAREQDMLHTIGLSLKETYFSLSGTREDEQAQRSSKLFVEKSDEVMVQHTALYEDALPCLQLLKQLGYQLGIVTTKYHRRIDAVFSRAHALEWFDVIFGGDDVQEPKPSPEGICSALNALKCSPSQALYVGDSTVDAQTAQAAGIDFAGVLTGTTPKIELEQYPHIGVYQSLSSLCIGTGLVKDCEVNWNV